MGSSFSFLGTQITAIKQPSPLAQPGLGDLPESCVASVLVFLDPQQICRLAMLNRAFNSASSADFLWELKLPPNYESLTKRVFPNRSNNQVEKKLCKKEVYARLCRPNSFDGGAKRAWLDKSTARVCLSIASYGLSITGIDDRRYWSTIPTDESRFSSVDISTKPGSLKLTGRSNFLSHQGPIAYSSGCN